MLTDDARRRLLSFCRPYAMSPRTNDVRTGIAVVRTTSGDDYAGWLLAAEGGGKFLQFLQYCTPQLDLNNFFKFLMPKALFFYLVKFRLLTRFTLWEGSKILLRRHINYNKILTV